jgi:hypothetical protein
MPKTVIASLFLGGVGAVVVGLLMAFGSISLGFAAGVYDLDGPTIVGARVTPMGYVMTGLAVTSAIALLGGALAVVVAWAGAMANVIAADHRGWLAWLVLLGLPTCGIAALVVYLLAGPEPVASPG